MFGTTSPRGVAAAMPRLTEDFSTISCAASSQAELSSGVFCSARQTALAMTNSGDSRRSANSRRALSRSSRSIVADTSQVTHSLTCGAVNADATIAWAVALRTPLIGMRVSARRPSTGSGRISSTGSGRMLLRSGQHRRG